jgi:hypothetical protein
VDAIGLAESVEFIHDERLEILWVEVVREARERDRKRCRRGVESDWNVGRDHVGIAAVSTILETNVRGCILWA